MIEKIQIQNFKSIKDLTLELGRVNVFIGENGCGKSNILEAIGFGVTLLNRVGRAHNSDFERIGIRLSKPNLIYNSFQGNEQVEEVHFALKEDDGDFAEFGIRADNADSIFKEYEWVLTDHNKGFVKRISKDNVEVDWHRNEYWDFAIYQISTLFLRGLKSESRLKPLGIYGEGLDVLINDFLAEEWIKLSQIHVMIPWLDKIIYDEADEFKNLGLKEGRSTSKLYFRDKYMQRKNNIFSAENANEGVLHILFYLALMISRHTPKFFAIDNIESSLNPGLCREVTKQICALSKQEDKQVLITTHNPAVLDGLNLHDDGIRLFKVFRSDKGHTLVDRIKVKPEGTEGKYKLSELWMRGLLGAVPTQF